MAGARKPNTTDIVKATEWIKKNRNLILEKRPTQLQLQKMAHEAGHVNMGHGSLMDICKEYNIIWTSTYTKKFTTKEMKAALGVLTGTLVGLFQKLGEPIPQELKILDNTLNKEEPLE